MPLFLVLFLFYSRTPTSSAHLTVLHHVSANQSFNTIHTGVQPFQDKRADVLQTRPDNLRCFFGVEHAFGVSKGLSRRMHVPAINGLNKKEQIAIAACRQHSSSQGR